MKAFIVYPTYETIDNKSFVKLYCKGEDGKSYVTVNEYRPYFWIRKSDLKKAKDLAKVDYEETENLDFSANKVTKVILDVVKDVPKLKKLFLDNGIPCYEADIRFAYRFLIDNNLRGCIEIEGKEENGVYTNPVLKPTDYVPKLKTIS